MNTIKLEKGKVRMVAHRGLSGIETENTNAAFVAAANRSYHAIETDIHRTADGKFVISHDSNLERVSGEKITIGSSTLSELQSVVLFDKDGTKNRLDLCPPTLENYLNICKKYEKHCVLELKSDFTDEEIATIIEIIKSFDYLDEVTFISFNYDNLKRVRKILPTHSAQYLFSNVTEDKIERAIVDKIDLDIEWKSLSKEYIDRFHAAGLVVNCWTVNSVEIAEKMIDMGIDYITTNILE